MGEKTGIKWCDHTFNPWIGCQRVSPGCEHCYAETLAVRAPNLVLGTGVSRTIPGTPRQLPVWGPQAPRRVTSAANWRQPLRWNKAALQAGVRRRVFCASLADVFEDYRLTSLTSVRVDLYRLIEATPALDWLLLTKRPQNVLPMLETAWPSWLRRWPANVWIGTTCEDQQRARERLPHLLRIPAPVRFVSYEPAIGPLDLSELDLGNSRGCYPLTVDEPGLQHIDWVIVGGESGPGARPFDLAWAQRIVAQCKAAFVPVFVKQMGARPIAGYNTLPPPLACGTVGLTDTHQALMMRDPMGGDMAEWPRELQVQEFPPVIW